MYRKVLLIVVIMFFSTLSAVGAESMSLSRDIVNKGGSENRRVSKSDRFPIIPDFINKISYDVKKTDSEIALLERIDTLSQEFLGKLSERNRTLYMESQLSWSDYYEKETYGLHPANGFVVLIISGDKKRINAYRENLNAILEERVSFIDGLLKNSLGFPYNNDEYDAKRAEFYQNRVEYFSEERNRPRVAEGEKAWKKYIEANDQFLEGHFADSPENIKMYKKHALVERFKILELQLVALERLRIEREE